MAAIAPGVRRITAPNPSPMTAEGTNTYLIGARAVAVIDPGPAIPSHLDAIQSAAAGRIAAIFVTHAHLDHSAGAADLAAAVGAPILGFGPAHSGRSDRMRRLAADNIGGGEGADEAYRPDVTVADGAAFASTDFAAGTAVEWRLTALHTPGHTSDHLSFALAGPAADEPSRALFCGDLVMGWSTSLISPPDGDMGAFMRSLGVLQRREDGPYLPGHGAPIADPPARLAELIAHRKGREAQILAALADGPSDAEGLVRRLYRDVDPRLHAMAARNVLAHLIDLWEREQIAPTGPFSAAAVFALTAG